MLRVHPTNPMCLTDGVWRVEYNPDHDDWSAGLCSRRFALGSYGKTAEEALERHREFCLSMYTDLVNAISRTEYCDDLAKAILATNSEKIL